MTKSQEKLFLFNTFFPQILSAQKIGEILLSKGIDINASQIKF